MAQYDLTSKISENLDRHLVAPLLEFLAAQNVCVVGSCLYFWIRSYLNLKWSLCLSNVFFIVLQIYHQQEVLQSKLDLLSETKMVDYAIDVFKKLHADKEVPKVRLYYWINGFLCFGTCLKAKC